MGYGDYTPSGNYAKKPLTKAQKKKIQQAYEQAGIISEQVAEKTEAEKEIAQKEIEEMLRMVL